jgi:hypothetical protein
MPLTLSHRPVLAERQHPYSAVIAHTDEGVGTHLIVNAHKRQIRVGPPVQRHVNIAWKDLPLRSVVKLDQVALGVLTNFHGLPVSRYPLHQEKAAFARLFHMRREAQSRHGH